MLELNNKKNIAILFSGGVESTLLYYLTLNQSLPETNIKLFIVDRYNNPIKRAFDLYNKLKVLWNDTRTSLSILSIPDFILPHKKLNQEYDCVILGLNKYPDDESIRPKFKENTFTDTNIKKLNKFANFILPFIDIQKDQTIQIYYNHGIEEILPMTHSCGSSELKPCGMCFNCKERIWAYNKLNKSLELGL
ncbi:uncharacterized protein METZ01_LOCUS156735 [marine metagenome]|jgi:hypothetical protein|uniref:7-cyano-7-deazaguanine synthase n=1 Tax=marine metagenome TaxID=408172 RepID=A0A382ARG6_9ZZZZ|tara:strand:- start:1414 stop:1989 length:576 start_codon:yes stop_codon:yes gene_type:complete